MKVHEYQAKEILAQHGVAVQRGIVADTVDEAVEAAETMAADGVTQFVVKAQIHAGGRGKGGGVSLVRSEEECRAAAEAIFAAAPSLSFSPAAEASLLASASFSPATWIGSDFSDQSDLLRNAPHSHSS